MLEQNRVNNLRGYQTAKYAESFNEIGVPCKLRHSNSWIIQRSIPHSHYYDAMGCYPFLACNDWNKLPEDLSELQDYLVSLTVVTDPSGDYTENLLQVSFPDLCRPFKKHFVVDLEQPWQHVVSTNHKRNAKKAYQEIEIDYISDPITYLDDWCRLYKILIQRHGITGVTAFSRKAFEQQLQTPGIAAHRAVYQEETVGMVLWYIHDRITYYHLGAYDDTGYAKRASFAIFWRALEEFAKQDIKYIFLGAGAGLDSKADDGLTRFKRGWANTTRTAYLCGRILQRDVYETLVQKSNPEKIEYFPAYRSPEFG